jgi:glycosyltransferase involved in cell wall biosynthesis
VTVFYATEDPSLNIPAEDVESNDNQVKIKTTYFKPFVSGFKSVDLIANSVKRTLHLHRLIRKEFRTGRPDIFHLSVMSPSVVIFWFYRLFYNIPFIYSEHWDIPIRVHFGIIKSWLPYRIGMKLCSIFAARVVVCSKAMRDLFIAFGLSDNVDIIQNVVYLDNKNIDDQKRLTGKKIILHVSSLGEIQKNMTGMIRGVAEVAKNRSDFELHILGYGKEFDHLNQLAKSLGILDTALFFHGFVSDEEKRDWFEKSMFHLLFSNFEGYSVVTAESIYYGRPVLVTKCGGPEDFVNEDNGKLIAPRDMQGLVNGINYMLDHYEHFVPESLRRYGEQIFSPPVVGMKHHMLYKDVLKRKR